MASRKTLTAPTLPSKAFLEGAPGETAVQEPAPTLPTPESTLGLHLTFPDEVEPTRPISMKIPQSLYNDIDLLRRHTNLNATEIFVKAATPIVAQLVAELKLRKGKGL